MDFLLLGTRAEFDLPIVESLEIRSAYPSPAKLVKVPTSILRRITEVVSTLALNAYRRSKWTRLIKACTIAKSSRTFTDMKATAFRCQARSARYGHLSNHSWLRKLLALLGIRQADCLFLE